MYFFTEGEVVLDLGLKKKKKKKKPKLDLDSKFYLVFKKLLLVYKNVNRNVI